MPEIDLSDRPQSREDLASWYAAVLADQASSGLSVTEYADAFCVTAATLYQWRRRLAAQLDDCGHGGSRSPLGLVEIMVSNDALVPTDFAVGFVVRLGCGRGIEVPSAFDDAELRRLVAVLESC